MAARCAISWSAGKDAWLALVRAREQGHDVPTFVTMCDADGTSKSHALAPGRHAITVDVERKDDRNDAFRNSQRTRFTVEVPRDQELAVQIKIGDDSDMGKDFPGDKSGSYDLRVRAKAEARNVGKK